MLGMHIIELITLIHILTGTAAFAHRGDFYRSADTLDWPVKRVYSGSRFLRLLLDTVPEDEAPPDSVFPQRSRPLLRLTSLRSVDDDLFPEPTPGKGHGMVPPARTAMQRSRGEGPVAGLSADSVMERIEQMRPVATVAPIIPDPTPAPAPRSHVYLRFG